MMSDSVFQHCKSMFERIAMGHFKSSSEYSTLDLRLEKLLVLADRLLAACDGHPQHGRVSSEVKLRLRKLLNAFESGGDASQAAVDLLAKLEIWLKSILWLAMPTRWERSRQKSEQSKTDGAISHFNLYQVIQDLRLLSEQELQTPVDRFSEIPDKVRQMILCAKEDRNELEHEGSQIPQHLRDRLPISALVSYLAPVIRYQGELQIALRRVVTRPPEFGPIVGPLARQIDSERRGHIERFAGREEWLSILKEKLTSQFDQDGGYILLTAMEGTGKSAIVSMLSQQWTTESSILGPHSTHVHKVAPWLPSVILHFGKASNLPSEIVPFLLEQISCCLASKLPAFGEIFPDSQIQDGFDQELSRVGREGSLSKLKDRTVPIGFENSYLADLDKEAYGRSSGYLHARRFLFDALEKLVAETGRVVLLVDALEEISIDGSRLAFLPERLPAGVSCLLTSRPQTAAETFVRSRLKNVEPIELKQLTRNEIPLLTKVSDGKPGGREFNDKVMESSDGLPLLVSGIGRHVSIEPDFTKVPVRGVRDRHFELKAKEWNDSGDMNREILGLLSIFEPVMPINLADIQAYLESQNLSVELAQIRQSLNPVAAQLQGLDISRVKLAMRPFAEYVRERYFSPRDLFARFQRVIDWLIVDDEVDPDIFGRLFMVWTNLQTLSEKQSELSKKHIELLSNLPTILLENNRDELLFRSASRILRESENISPTAVECLRYAAQLGSLKAMRTFSNLIDGELSEELKQEAIAWVQKGAEQEDAVCMMIIGNRLIDGTGVEKDVEKGSKWLTKSAESGFARGMMSLGLRLVQCDGLERNTEDGLKWLKKASLSNHVPADFILGQLLVYGDQIEQDVDAGIVHLEKAIATGFIPAIRLLSNCYIRGIHVEKDVNRGIALLEKAISLDDESAVLSLAHRYLTGESVQQNEEKGLALLETGVAKNQTLAKRALGFEFVTGKNIAKPNHERGVSLLQEAIEAGDAPSMEILADFLLDVKKSEVDTAKQLLIRAIEDGYDSAAINLVKRLGKGKGLPKNPEAAMKLLRGYAAEDRQQIRWELGRALIECRFGERSTEEGLKIMESLCQDGDVSAILYLAQQLLHGEEVQQDIKRGVALLEGAVAAQDTDAMISLAKHLFESNKSQEEISRGLDLLRKAHQAGDIEATFELGKNYLSGDLIEKNSKLAIEYIGHSSRCDYEEAMLLLAKELITGKNTERDEHEAGILLQRISQKSPEHLVNTGMELYEMGEKYWAAWCFFAAFKKNQLVAGNNLAFMVRRNEVPETLAVPPALALVSPGAKEGCGFSLINQALCIAAGIGTTVDWKRADRCIAEVPSLIDAQPEDRDGHPFHFWYKLTKDPPQASEGQLVVGWLSRHKKIEDPEGMQSSERFLAAREGGWDVPNDFFD